MSILSEALAEGRALEHTDLPDGYVGVRRNKDAARPYTVRLTPEDVERLEELAERRGIPASTLARGMIQRGLTEADGGLSAALDRASLELKRVQDLLGR